LPQLRGTVQLKAVVEQREFGYILFNVLKKYLNYTRLNTVIILGRKNKML